jgi:hypothetical protein
MIVGLSCAVRQAFLFNDPVEVDGDSDEQQAGKGAGGTADHSTHDTIMGSTADGHGSTIRCISIA